MLPLALQVVITAVLGAGLGHLSRCTNGGCTMFSNWKRGLLVGAIMGLVSGLRFLHV